MMLQVLRRHFRIPAQDRDIIHAFSGVRPLYDENAENPSAVTRKYVLEIDGTPEVPPPVPIVGCKITTYRRLAEHALRRLVPWFPTMSPARTNVAIRSCPCRAMAPCAREQINSLSFALVDRQRRTGCVCQLQPWGRGLFSVGAQHLFDPYLLKQRPHPQILASQIGY